MLQPATHTRPLHLTWTSLRLSAAVTRRMCPPFCRSPRPSQRPCFAMSLLGFGTEDSIYNIYCLTRPLEPSPLLEFTKFGS